MKLDRTGMVIDMEERRPKPRKPGLRRTTIYLKSLIDKLSRDQKEQVFEQLLKGICSRCYYKTEDPSGICSNCFHSGTL